MSSLVSLKKDIDEIEKDLYLEVEKQLNFEEQLENQIVRVVALTKHLKKLKRALDILEGNDLPEPTEAKTPPPSEKPLPAAPTKPADIGPRCSACGAKMYPQVTRAPSGVLIQHLRCDDCGNEAY